MTETEYYFNFELSSYMFLEDKLLYIIGSLLLEIFTEVYKRALSWFC